MGSSATRIGYDDFRIAGWIGEVSTRSGRNFLSIQGAGPRGVPWRIKPDGRDEVLTRRAWLFGSVAVAVVCLLATPALADVTVTGDRSAYDEVVAAFKKLFSLPGFRAKYTSTERQGQVVFEYAAPNSWHFGARGGPYEIIHVAGQVATRGNIPGTTPEWRCRTARDGDRRFLFDPTRATGTYNLSRGPDTVIDGTAVHTILWREGDKRTTYYVGSQSGLPKRVIANDGREAIDYYDYGAQVVITLPPCAQ